MEPPRETISLLITSILGGLALTYSISEIQITLSDKGLSIPLYSITFFIVFVSIWLRFIPGNISHIRRLERWPMTVVKTWLLDIAVITLESAIIVFMAKPSVNDPDIFLYAMLTLLFVDVIWLAAMIPGAKKRNRPCPQWAWLLLNLPSIAVVVALTLLNILNPDLHLLTNEFVLAIIGIVFCVSACLDVKESVSDWFGRPRQPVLSTKERKKYEKNMREAIKEAKKSLASNGIPIGAILVENGNIVGRGHNRRIQDKNPMAHAEIECLKDASLKQGYEGTTLYSTLMPCCLCAGAIIQFGIKKVVVAEAENFDGARSLLEDCGVKVTILDMDECIDMLANYIQSNRTIWDDDIGRSKK